MKQSKACQVKPTRNGCVEQNADEYDEDGLHFTYISPLSDSSGSFSLPSISPPDFLRTPLFFYSFFVFKCSLLGYWWRRWRRGRWWNNGSRRSGKWNGPGKRICVLLRFISFPFSRLAISRLSTSQARAHRDRFLLYERLLMIRFWAVNLKMVAVFCRMRVLTREWFRPPMQI